MLDCSSCRHREKNTYLPQELVQRFTRRLHRRLAASLAAPIEAPPIDLDVSVNVQFGQSASTTSTTSASSTSSSSSTSTLSSSTNSSSSTTFSSSTNSSSSTSTTSSSSSTSSSSTSSSSTTTNTNTTTTTTTTTTATAATTTTFTGSTTTTFTDHTTIGTTLTDIYVTTSTAVFSTTYTLFTPSPSGSTLSNVSSASPSTPTPTTSGVLGSGQNDATGFAHNTGAIVGVGVGVLVFIIGLVLLLFFTVKRFRRSQTGGNHGFTETFRPPIDDDPELAVFPLSPPTSLGHGEDGDAPLNLMTTGPGSEIHGASVESGGTSYPHSQGHSTSSGDHLLSNSGAYAPFVLPTPITPSEHLRGGLESPPPIPSPSSSTGPLMTEKPRSRSLFQRMFGSGGGTKQSSPSSSRPESIATDAGTRMYVSSGSSLPSPSPSSLPPVPVFSSPSPVPDTDPTRTPPPPWLQPDTFTHNTLLQSPSVLRERNLSAPEGLLHPRRPDLITLESSRTLMDHVDYSRPILPTVSHARYDSNNTTDSASSDVPGVSGGTKTLDTPSSSKKAPDTMGDTLTI